MFGLALCRCIAAEQQIENHQTKSAEPNVDTATREHCHMPADGHEGRPVEGHDSAAGGGGPVAIAAAVQPTNEPPQIGRGPRRGGGEAGMCGTPPCTLVAGVAGVGQHGESGGVAGAIVGGKQGRHLATGAARPPQSCRSVNGQATTENRMALGCRVACILHTYCMHTVSMHRRKGLFNYSNHTHTHTKMHVKSLSTYIIQTYFM